MENLCPIDESGIISRTESLGLKCLADRPLLHAQMSTDSVFSRVTEGETMEPPDEDDSQVKPKKYITHAGGWSMLRPFCFNLPYSDLFLKLWPRKTLIELDNNFFVKLSKKIMKFSFFY